MTDPLGLIAAQRVQPVQPVGQRGGQGVAPGQQLPPGQSFKDVLLKNIEQVNALDQDATRAIEDMAQGKRNDLEGVLLATQKADTAFRMLQAVRNKVVAAYDEIKQMRV